MADTTTKDRFDIVNGKQLALLIAPTLCFVAASAAVAARWYTRSVRRINTVTEDALMLAALAMSFVVVTMVYVLVFLGGEGLTSDEIRADPTKEFNVVNRFWLRMQFALDICWATSIATVQIAFAKAYVRLYERKRVAQVACWISIGLIAIWYIWSLAGWISMCHPPGKCELQSKRSCIIIGSLHVFFNSVILFAPVPALMGVELSAKKRWSVMVLFLLGCFCTILAVLRIDCAINVFGDVNVDPIGASWWRICFSPIEIAVGIICCCVPNVRSLPSWRRNSPIVPNENHGLRRLKFRTTSSGSSTSNLNEPSQWMPHSLKPQAAAFVTLTNESDNLERAGSLGANEIKVTKEYNLDRL
ncbi:integral membrane protein [Curvularia clavata]|uniref:Integral membrane protein n=1 Tax=Curvularia clavata TaxID=95742 RepID=A0A9Q8ZDV2_CURCL|nr:integral membrane protein [Curvularia clavata]